MTVVVQTNTAPPDHEPLDVLIVVAVKDEWEAVLSVDTGAVPATRWERLPSTEPEVRTRRFETEAGSLRVAVVQALGMGREHAVIVASPLLERYKEIRCLAMCGVCAGSRGDVSLGDVIVADRSWSYDAGKLKATIDDDGSRVESFQGDVELYRIEPPPWKQAAERFQPDVDAAWAKQRPASYEQQGEWLLERLVAGEDPLQHDDRRTKCPDWGAVVQQLWKARWLIDQQLTLSERGREHIQRRLLLAPDGLPANDAFKVVVGPIASGAPVVEDPTIFGRLAATQGMRKLLGLEMESSAILALAYVQKLPFAVVMKGVMDHADAFKSDNMKPFAARASAECLIAFLRQNLPSGGAEYGATRGLEQVAREARARSKRLLDLWARRHKFAAHRCVRLKLRKWKSASDQSRDVEEMELDHVADELERSHHVVLSGRPGAGKTLTLLQLAEVMHANPNARVPVVVSVAAWVSSEIGLSAYVAHELFSDDDPDTKAKVLFENGRIALLLNGWNEAEEKRQVAANEALRDFNLHYPEVPIVVTTRDTKLEPAALDAIRIEVAQLSATQKTTIVNASGLFEPDGFLAQLGSNRSLADVTDTPLFLAAAIQLALRGRAIPDTRAQLLDAFVDEAEHTDNHFDVLQSGPCRGFHRRYLECVAGAMMSHGLTVLNADECHRALADCGHELVRQGHLSDPFSGADIADSLARHHLLVPVAGTPPTYEFLHQQFQELFAAHSLERRILALVGSQDQLGVASLQREILDRHQWRVPTELAIELLMNASKHAVATQLVRWFMPLDLIVAAELCDAAGEQVWSALRAEFVAPLRELYAVGGNHRMCALSAMLASGSSDFADLIWAEVEGDEQPFYALTTLCSSYLPFRAKSLGEGWETRVAQWIDRKQEAFLLEVFPGDDEIAFAEERARSATPDVRKAAFALLRQRAQFDRILRVLDATNVDNWIPDVVAAIWMHLPQRFKDRFTEATERRLTFTQDPMERRAIIEALRIADDARWAENAQREMEVALAELDQAHRPLFPGDVPAPISAIAHHASLLRSVDVESVASWLARKLGRNLWRRPFTSYFGWFPDEVVRWRIEHVTESIELEALSRCVADLAAAGQNVIDALVAHYLRTGHQGLRSALRDVALSTLAPSIVRRAQRFASLEERDTLVDLVLPGQVLDPRLQERLDPRLRSELRALVHRFAVTLEEAADTSTIRAQTSVLLASLGQKDDLATVVAWAMSEQRRWEDYHSRSGQRRRAEPYGVSHWWWYRSAIAQFESAEAEHILTRWLDSEFLIGEGAAGLVELSQREGSLSQLPETSTPWKPPPSGAAIGPTPTDIRVGVRATLIVRALEKVNVFSIGETRRARAAAIVALAKLGDERAIDLLLQDQALNEWEVLDGALSMLRRGMVVPGRALESRLATFLDAHTASDRIADINSWGAVTRVLTVLLGSDDPVMGADRIRSLLAHPLPIHCFRDLCSLLTTSRNPVSTTMLIEASRSVAHDEVRWREVVEALASNTNPACHEQILELLTDGARRSADSNKLLVRAATEVAATYPAFLAKLMTSLIVSTGDVAHRIAEVLAEAGDEQTALALLQYADPKFVERPLRRLVQRLTETRIDISTHPGAYLIRPREAASLRRHLAAQLVSGDSKRCAVASRLLAQIRTRRVTEGSLPPDEPLHPDVTLISRIGGDWELCCVSPVP